MAPRSVLPGPVLSAPPAGRRLGYATGPGGGSSSRRWRRWPPRGGIIWDGSRAGPKGRRRSRKWRCAGAGTAGEQPNGGRLDDDQGRGHSRVGSLELLSCQDCSTRRVGPPGTQDASIQFAGTSESLQEPELTRDVGRACSCTKVM